MEGITKVLWQQYVMIVSYKAAALAPATTQTSKIAHESLRYNDVRRRAGLSLQVGLLL